MKELLVRVYRPEAKWIATLAASRRPGDALREQAFRIILEGKAADMIPLSEARRLRV